MSITIGIDPHKASHTAVAVDDFETVIDEEQAHFNYFDNVSDHIKQLGAAYLAKIAGTSSATGLGGAGFVAAGGAE